jgi:acyl phosphate:glycerol-3-phosphate acyltransferase
VAVVSYIVPAAVSYFLGSIPTGFLVGKARGIDIRTVGSGNIGATNVFRALGKTAGVFVLLADAAKGFLACWLIGPYFSQRFGAASGPGEPAREWYSIVAGVSAILGHNYTCWLGFKGGKGVATTGGVLLALFPKAAALGVAVWLIVLAVSRYVSLASISAALSLPLGVWVFGGSRTFIAVAGLLGVLGIYKHKSNIQRLLTGTEHQFGRKQEREETT